MRLKSTLVMRFEVLIFRGVVIVSSRLWNHLSMLLLLLDVFKLLSNWLSMVVVNNRFRLNAKMWVKSAHLSLVVWFFFFDSVIFGLMSVLVKVLALGNSVAKVVSATFVILFESVEFFGGVVLAIWRR